MDQKSILVCVTQQKNCEHLITEAARIAQSDDSIYVLHVLGNNEKLFNHSSESEALEYLFTVSKSIGAPMTVQRSDDTLGSIAEFVRSKTIRLVILGVSPESENSDSFSMILKERIPDCEIVTL